MPFRPRRAYSFLPTLCMLLAHFNVCAAATNQTLGSITASIQEALTEHDYQGAFILAQKGLLDFGGEPEFDYVYARSAIEVAKYYEAIFALERILSIWPTHVPSHYLLGLTYIRQKNYVQAKVILSGLLYSSIDADLRSNITDILSSLDNKLQAKAHTLNHRFSISFGHDTNVNSGTLDDRIVVGGIPILLDESSQETADNFMRTRYRLKGQWQQTQYDSWNLSLNLSDQRHQDTHEFDRYQGNIRFGFKSKKDDFMYSVGGQFGVLTLDSNTYQQDFGLDGMLQYSFKEHWFAAINGVALSQNNVSDRNLDSQIYTLQGGIGYVGRSWLIRLDIGHTWQPARYDEGEHFARDYDFISSTVIHRLTEQQSLDLKVLYRDIKHRANHPFFLAARTEELVSLKASWRYQWNTAWSADISVSHYDKNSSISIYSYERTEWFTGVYYEF